MTPSAHVDTFARWRISDVVKCYQRLRDEQSVAMSRVLR